MPKGGYRAPVERLVGRHGPSRERVPEPSDRTSVNDTEKGAYGGNLYGFVIPTQAGLSGSVTPRGKISPVVEAKGSMPAVKAATGMYNAEGDTKNNVPQGSTQAFEQGRSGNSFNGRATKTIQRNLKAYK